MYLVEADALELATEVDALRTDAENSFLLESTLSVDRPDGHCGRQRRWNSDCNYVKNSEDDYSSRLLQNNITILLILLKFLLYNYLT